MIDTHVPTPTTTLSTGFLTDFVQRWGAAWNGHAPDQLLSLMSEDIVYDDSAWPVTMRGHVEPAHAPIRSISR